MKLRNIILNLSIFTLLTTQPSYAFELFSVGANVTTNNNVKIDVSPSLKEMVERLPSEVREQFIQGVREAMPILDNSVYGYMNQVDFILKDLMQNGMCKFTGAVGNGAEVGIERTLGKRNKILLKLYNEYKALDYQDINKAPPEYQIQYAELSRYASNIQCGLIKGTVEENQVLNLEIAIAKRYLVWKRLGGYCTNSYNCYEYAKKDLKKFLDESDPRDLTSSEIDAINRYNKLPSPTLYYPTKKGFFSKETVQFKDIENNLLEVFNIYDGVTYLKIARLEKEKLSDSKALEIINKYRTEFDKNVTITNDGFKKRGTSKESLGYALNLITQYINSNQFLKQNLKEAQKYIIYPDTLNSFNTLNVEIDQNELKINNDIRTIQDEISKIPPPPKPKNPRPRPWDDGGCSRYHPC